MPSRPRASRTRPPRRLCACPSGPIVAPMCSHWSRAAGCGALLPWRGARSSPPFAKCTPQGPLPRHSRAVRSSAEAPLFFARQTCSSLFTLCLRTLRRRWKSPARRRCETVPLSSSSALLPVFRVLRPQRTLWAGRCFQSNGRAPGSWFATPLTLRAIFSNSARVWSNPHV